MTGNFILKLKFGFVFWIVYSHKETIDVEELPEKITRQESITILPDVPEEIVIDDEPSEIIIGMPHKVKFTWKFRFNNGASCKCKFFLEILDIYRILMGSCLYFNLHP